MLFHGIRLHLFQYAFVATRAARLVSSFSMIAVWQKGVVGNNGKLRGPTMKIVTTNKLGRYEQIYNNSYMGQKSSATVNKALFYTSDAHYSVIM